MAVVEVKMVSGYSVDTNELERYIDYLYSTGQDIGLMRYDHFEEGKPFSLYFNQFSRGYSTSFVLVLKRDIHVKNTRPAFIKVYDYYEGGVVTTSPTPLFTRLDPVHPRSCLHNFELIPKENPYQAAVLYLFLHHFLP
ncbi:hypothetical protein BSL78_05281 [Apostichopus japonicus]|uniref:Alpha-macroglobulin receptor-binding domain-containing protein n=1 Tax=Stichopus japonicus TaxID=307972 RepID=A0A2G8LC44_STIJA|nr:hypothetical protein BSL78_05281 [Apostichopus japonicus]